MEQMELFWAFVIAIVLASALSVIGYLYPNPNNQEIFRIANDLVTGALGFFAGRATSRVISGKSE